jgi:hypothetical protein
LETACAQTAVEQNPGRQIEFIRQINDLFPVKRHRLERPDDEASRSN